MGLMPKDFYSLSMREWKAKVKGWHKHQKNIAYLLRRQAYIIHASLVEKPLDPEQLWPIDKIQETKETQDERLLRKLSNFKQAEWQQKDSK